MKKGVLLRLHFKRTLRIYPEIFCITLVTFLLMVAVIFSFINGYNNSEKRRKLDIAIVGDCQESYIDIGVHFLQNFDSSRFFMNFTQMSEEEAQKSLKKGEISGYIYIPDDFDKNINSKIKYIVNNSPVNVTPVISAEVISVVSEIVSEIQSGSDSLAETEGEKKAKKFVLKCADFIVNRQNSYELHLIGVKDSVSLPQYYVCGILMFFLLIWAVPCHKLINWQTEELKEALYCRGIGAGFQLICEFVTFFCVTVVTLELFAVIIGVVNSLSGGSEGVFSAVSFVFKMIPVIIMTTSMHIASGEIFKGGFNAVLTGLIIAIATGHISGFFYPIYFFPESIQNLSAILPSGVGFSYARMLIKESINITSLIASMLYSIFFIFVSYVLRRKRMEVR